MIGADAISVSALSCSAKETDYAAPPSAATASSPPPAAGATASAKLEPAPAGHVAATPARAAVEIPAGAVTIKSPMVGTFYRSPEPGAKPFVEVGQRVSADTTVCIIEVMKLMNSIAAGCEGTVTHVLANDAEAVDVGQLLIIIDPKA